jgi:ABC-type multidrug transport system ATPase subunit
MISAEHVTKKYGKTAAARDISMQVLPGEAAVLLGPNGAGKSTLIKSICGLLRFDGRITIGGFDNHDTRAKRILGYVPEIPALYPMLTVFEHLEFIARAYRLDGWQTRADELIRRFELDDKRNKLGKELSKGMQQKVSICCAVLHEPKAVILDEPLVGLDPHAIRELKTMLAEMKSSGCSLIISTHIIESVADDWDAVYIMMNGEVRKTCRRTESEGINLEELFFAITESEKTGMNG